MTKRKTEPEAKRKVWRMTTDAPQGALFDSSPAPVPPAAEPQVAPKILDPAPVANWKDSSHDLLSGAEVTDFSETIPAELFDKLFKS